MKREYVINSTLLTALKVRSTVASQFRPSAAKTLFTLFEAKKIYDPCAGWGDRLVAAMACKNVEEYHGLDANGDLQGVYNGIIKSYSPKLENVKKLKVDVGCAEKFLPTKNYFDLVFTSPPYWNCESYAKGTRWEKLQSWKLYPTLEEWKCKFLYPMLRNSWKCLKKGGHLIINIADIKVSKQRVAFCDEMNDYIKVLGGTYIGCPGYQLSKRVNTTRNEDSNIGFAEPIWIWQK